MNNYNTIIFDLDGTLLNTLDDITDSVNYILNSNGYPKRTYEEIRNFIGMGAAKLIELALPNGSSNPDYEKCLGEYVKYYGENMDNKTAPYEGIYELLNELKKRKCKIAVVSNKTDAGVKKLCRKYFNDYIFTSIGETEDLKKKPAPDMLLKALKQLNSNGENSLFIGDADTDIQTAENANISCVSVSWGYRDREFLSKKGASLIIDEPNELIEIIDEHHRKLSSMES